MSEEDDDEQWCWWPPLEDAIPPPSTPPPAVRRELDAVEVSVPLPPQQLFDETPAGMTAVVSLAADERLDLLCILRLDRRLKLP